MCIKSALKCSPFSSWLVSNSCFLLLLLLLLLLILPMLIPVPISLLPPASQGSHSPLPNTYLLLGQEASGRFDGFCYDWKRLSLKWNSSIGSCSGPDDDSCRLRLGWVVLVTLRLSVCHTTNNSSWQMHCKACQPDQSPKAVCIGHLPVNMGPKFLPRKVY